MKVYAPGKLILSGEHAVVYGQPALAMAVNRYATATVTREGGPRFLLDLADLAHRSHFSVDGLQQLKSRIKRKYQRFMNGEYTIRQVLHKPFELAQVALGIFAESFNISLSHGVKIQVASTIPIGCGMGSSAATIISVLYAISSYFDVPLTTENLYQLALEAENMQHGRSSGVDLRVALNGGCLYVNEQQQFIRPVPNLTMYLVNTGTPLSSTGQCVAEVATHFQSLQLGQDFAAITNAMDQALQQQSPVNMCDAIRGNHQLLTAIGVVPSKVQQFIQQIEAGQGAAKICGAGAVTGDQAGAVLVVTDDQARLEYLVKQYGYQVLPIMGESRGVHAG